MPLMIEAEDVLISKPKCSNVVVERAFDEEAGTYEENVHVTVYSEYMYLDTSDGLKLKTDRQWNRYDLDPVDGDPTTVVPYALAAISNDIYGLEPVNFEVFYPSAPVLPDAPT